MGKFIFVENVFFYLGLFFNRNLSCRFLWKLNLNEI